jgi:hypothetical protein
MDVFTSYMATQKFMRRGSEYERQMKISCIYHDRIVMPVHNAQYNMLMEEFFLPGLTEKEKKSLRRIVVPPWEIAENVDGQKILETAISPVREDTRKKIERGLKGAARRVICSELGVSVSQSYKEEKRGVDEIHEWRGNVSGEVGNAMAGAEAWRRVNQSYPISYLAQTEVEHIAAGNLISGLVSPTSGRAAMDQIEALVPSFGKLAWSDALELRQSPGLHNFRTWLSSSSGLSDAEQVIDSLWDAVSQIIPSTNSHIIRGIVTNLPSPILINPAGVASSARDVRQAARFHNEHGAMVFLHDIWTRTKNPARRGAFRKFKEVIGFKVERP